MERCIIWRGPYEFLEEKKKMPIWTHIKIRNRIFWQEDLPGFFVSCWRFMKAVFIILARGIYNTLFGENKK